jgi:hypothetical protein
MTEITIADTRFAPIPGIKQAAKDFVYLVLGLPLGIVSFTFAVTMLSLSAGLAITFVGIPLFVLMLVASRWFARIEGARAVLVVDDPVVVDPPLEGDAIERG